jgi:hypothetical protein
MLTHYLLQAEARHLLSARDFELIGNAIFAGPNQSGSAM